MTAHPRHSHPLPGLDVDRSHRLVKVVVEPREEVELAIGQRPLVPHEAAVARLRAHALEAGHEQVAVVRAHRTYENGRAVLQAYLVLHGSIVPESGRSYMPNSSGGGAHG